MNAVIIYDSAYGNTEKIAQAIASTVGDFARVKLLRIKDAEVSDLDNIDTLIIGSPTQGGRPTQAIQDFINSLDKHTTERIRIAAFDTRFAKQDHGLGLRMLMNTIGFAAPKLTKSLKAKGAEVLAEPRGFIVADKDGPLQQGETERAKDWARAFSET